MKAGADDLEVGSQTSASSALTTSTSQPVKRMPFSRLAPKTIFSPGTRSIMRSPRTFLSTIGAWQSRLKMTQFWRMSMKEVPRCRSAAAITLAMCFGSASMVRATKVALHPRAKEIGLKGRSTAPIGEVFVRCPSGEVGEYCPLVSP